ncbi:trypsin-like serine protease [Actinocatenispora rupis]|uniref:Serine protease n=1 Tax=Actinocatenispora rupis TaxID=519421 RepID=A0A8J3JFC2_9ACTN|nr:serine protease [Actinocatenispora rupis]
MKHRHTLAGIAAAITAAAALIATPASASNAVAPQIIGGAPATGYGFSTSLQILNRDDPNWHTCGGTLVAARFVATNAHCVDNMPAGTEAATSTRFAAWANAAPHAIDLSDPSIYHLRLGSTDRLHGGVVRHVTRIVTYPSWAWGQPGPWGEIGDLALLQLDRPVTTVRPAPILPARTTMPAREIGWGITTQPDQWDENTPSPATLSQIDAPLAPASACAEAGIGAGELCLGVPASDGGVCLGDSGSPALQRIGRSWGVIGSTSRLGGERCGVPNVYTDLSNPRYLAWMIRTIYHLPAGAPTAGKSLATAP